MCFHLSIEKLSSATKFIFGSIGTSVVNTEHCRIWCKELPEAVQDLPMHPERCTLWKIGPGWHIVTTRRWYSHPTRDTIYLLRDDFGEKFISLFGAVHLSPRSCNFAPLDFFLWGYVKCLVYRDKPATTPALEDTITTLPSVRIAEMLEKYAINGTYGWNTYGVTAVKKNMK